MTKKKKWSIHSQIKGYFFKTHIFIGFSKPHFLNILNLLIADLKNPCFSSLIFFSIFDKLPYFSIENP